MNCVWDNYRDEVEDWAAKRQEARRRVQAQGTSEAGSVDDDGGRETNWTVGADASGRGKVGDEADLFEGVPVGIREFMRVEKRLKERHKAEAAAAAG